MPDSNNKANDNADLPRLSGRSRYGPATDSEASAIAGAHSSVAAVGAEAGLNMAFAVGGTGAAAASGHVATTGL
jgi:hypothetical protein